MEEKIENQDSLETLEDEELQDEDLENQHQEENSVKKVQSHEENRFYAALRRKNAELEKKNQELEVKATEADFNARKKVIPGDVLNDLGIDYIEDDLDLLLCEEYLKAKDKGSENPILDANKILSAHIRKEKQKESAKRKAQKENEDLVLKDKEEFKKKFEIDASEALKDPKFMELYGDMISYGNMTSLYERYQKFMHSKEMDEEARKMGSIPHSSTRKASKEKSINDLEGEEFLKAFNDKYH